MSTISIYLRLATLEENRNQPRYHGKNDRQKAPQGSSYLLRRGYKPAPHSLGLLCQLCRYIQLQSGHANFQTDPKETGTPRKT